MQEVAHTKSNKNTITKKRTWKQSSSECATCNDTTTATKTAAETCTKNEKKKLKQSNAHRQEVEEGRGDGRVGRP